MPAASNPVSVVVGLGTTGLSCVRYLVSTGKTCKVIDSRDNPPGLDSLRKEYPQIEYELGGFNPATLNNAEQLIVSPGVSLKTPEIAAAIAAGVPITGDIDIFSRACSAPIIGITGSNGKSTMVSMLASIFQAASLRMAVGGNLEAGLGRPALDLLEQDAEIYALELSSFQLETTTALNAEVAVLLNISEDHMDRYDDMAGYASAKQRIFTGARKLVVNRDEPETWPAAELAGQRWDFGFSRPGPRGVGLLESEAGQFLGLHHESIVPVSELKVVGQHNIANAMAAVAVALALDIDRESIRQGLGEFPGLPHRCQWVATHQGVEFYNDSKGTNVGAAVAAIEGLGLRIDGHIILIAGGEGKGADFAPLAAAVNRWARVVVLIGRDAVELAGSLDAHVETHFAASMEEAVSVAREHAKAGDAVLLSPACASFDMFDNFQHRGETFIKAVRAVQ